MFRLLLCVSAQCEFFNVMNAFFITTSRPIQINFPHIWDFQNDQDYHEDKT
jgi:hypothetical protein